MTTPVYDPNKRYTWGKDDIFELSGNQFGTLLNAFRSVLNTPEAARILTISHANDIIEDLMAENVKKGIVIEVPETATSGEVKPHKLTLEKNVDK